MIKEKHVIGQKRNECLK